MQSTIKYFIEIYGKNTETELSRKLNLGIPKISKNGSKYILIEEEIKKNLHPFQHEIFCSFILVLF